MNEWAHLMVVIVWFWVGFWFNELGWRSKLKEKGGPEGTRLAVGRRLYWVIQDPADYTAWTFIHQIKRTGRVDHE